MHPEFNFSSKYASINNHRIHYLDEGQGDVVVLVHGNPTWSFFYRNVIKALRSQYRVIAFDHVGCGLSDKPTHFDYTLTSHIQMMSDFLSHLKIDRCSLIVHDWGGAIGFGYAIANTPAIDKIVVLNTAAFRSKKIPLRIALCKIPVFGEIVVRALNGFAWPATFMAVAKSMDKETKGLYLKPYDSWKNRIAVHRFVKDIPLNTNHVSYSKLLEIESKLSLIRNSNIPLLVLWGGKDFCFTKQFYDEWLLRFPDCESHYFEEFGHYLLEDGKDVIAQYIKKFFR